MYWTCKLYQSPHRSATVDTLNEGQENSLFQTRLRAKDPELDL